jgi:hypothetical protein
VPTTAVNSSERGRRFILMAANGGVKRVPQ